MKAKVNTKSNYRNLNGQWLEVKEIVGTSKIFRARCLFNTCDKLILHLHKRIVFNVLCLSRRNKISDRQELSIRRISAVGKFNCEKITDNGRVYKKWRIRSHKI